MLIYLSPERRTGNAYAVDGWDEKRYCENMASYVQQGLVYNGFTVHIADPDKLIVDRAEEANQMNADLYVCIHSNGSVNHDARGLECLYYGTIGNDYSYRFNNCVYRRLLPIIGNGRGLKDGNLYIENYRTEMTSAYIEMAFHDNLEDCKILLSNIDEIAAAIVQGICDYTGVTYRSFKINPNTGR